MQYNSYVQQLNINTIKIIMARRQQLNNVIF